jgi:hypothetical protein
VFLAPALFEAEADKAGRVESDDDAPGSGAVTHDFLAAPPHRFSERRHDWFFRHH